MKWFLSYLWINVGNIKSEIRLKIISVLIQLKKTETNWNFTGCHMPHFMIVLIPYYYQIIKAFLDDSGVVGWCEGVMYLMSPGRPTDIGLQLGKACYPCSR